MAAGSLGIAPVPLGQIISVGVFNNSQKGEQLVIWDCQVYANPAGTSSSINTIDFNIMQGQGTFASNPGRPIVSDQPLLPGIVWMDKPLSESGKNIYSLSLPAQGYQWVHDWPMAVIGVGLSFAVFSDANASQEYGVTFAWEVASNI